MTSHQQTKIVEKNEHGKRPQDAEPKENHA